MLKSTTPVAMAAMGIGIPLILIIITLSFCLLRERQRTQCLTLEKSHLKAIANYHKGIAAEYLKVSKEIDGDAMPTVLKKSDVSSTHEISGAEIPSQSERRDVLKAYADGARPRVSSGQFFEKEGW